MFKVTQNQDVSGSGLMGLKNDMLASLKRRYPAIEGNLTLACATLLDPRFKEIPFEDQNMLQNAKNKLMRDMEEGVDNVTLPVEAQTSTNSNEVQGFWARYAEVFKESSSTIQNPPSLGVEEELTQYLREQPLHPKQVEKLGSYWFSSPHSRLRTLAMKYLCVPPSTVFSERLFSTAGNICDQKRNRLDPERIKMLVFLNKNLK